MGSRTAAMHSSTRSARNNTRLLSCLRALKRALARAQPNHRREAIQLLSLPLRRELLWLMESVPSSPTPAATAARPVPDCHGTPAARGLGSGTKLCRMQGRRGLQK
ncbi:unnamed protein product, partial [Symbiodinium sp. CCMP2456]